LNEAVVILLVLLLATMVGGGGFLFFRNHFSPAPPDVTGTWNMTVTTSGVAVGYTLALQQRGHKITGTLTSSVLGSQLGFPVTGSLSGSSITFDDSGEFSRVGPENDHYAGTLSDATHMAGTLTATILPINGSNPYTVAGTWGASKTAASGSAICTQGLGNCARTSVGLTPLTDLGTGNDQGLAGELYPQGSHQAPASYVQAGVAC
jgi:hypothetical protein